MKEVQMKKATTIVIALSLLIAFTPRFAAAQATKPAVKQIDTQQFNKMRSEKDTVVLDVRTPQEFNQGHVPGAVNLDINDPQFPQKVEKLDKSKTYLVHCARGVRSARAARLMSPMGFTSLFDYHGGFEAWKQSGKPIERPAPSEPGK
jgi:rhodanese-related sulfurtransferase